MKMYQVVSHLNEDEDCAAFDVAARQESPSEQQLQSCIDGERWHDLQQLLEDDPFLSCCSAVVYHHGERISCSPLHAVCARKSPCLDVVETLVTMRAASLREGDTARQRLPLHMALLRGCESAVVIRYLCQRNPRALLQPDLDGNLPLHLACLYSPPAVLRCVTDETPLPQAARMPNAKGRLPLHLTCARGGLDLLLVRRLLRAYAPALQEADRFGRLPLHWSCDQAVARLDIVSELVQRYPPSLLRRDHAMATPVQLAKRYRDGGAVVNFLCQRTTRERHKLCAFQAFFTIRPPEQRQVLTADALQRLFTIRLPDRKLLPPTRYV